MQSIGVTVFILGFIAYFIYVRKTAARQKMGAPDGADIVEWVKGF